MTTQRARGPYGQGGGPLESVDDGTGGAFRNFPPGPVGILVQDGDDLLAELQQQTEWLDIRRIAVRLLGDLSFGFGVVDGIGEKRVSSSVDLAALAKVFVLADLHRGLDGRAAIVEAVGYACMNPGEGFDGVDAIKWARFRELDRQSGLSARFEAGKFMGGLLLALLSPGAGGAAIAKLATRFPALRKLGHLLQKAEAALLPKGR